MTQELSHEQAADEIEAVALGIATEEITQGVTAHAAKCAECAAELQSFYGVVTALAGLIPARPLNRGHSAGIKSRLLAKAAVGQERSRRSPRAEPARQAGVRSNPIVARPPRVEEAHQVGRQESSNAPMWIAAVAALIALGSLAAWMNARGGSDSQAGGNVEAPSNAERVAELERTVAEREATIASVSGPGVRIISLFNREAREPLARMFWDRRNDRWTLFVYTLRQPRSGKTFHVWLGTDNGRVPLGNFRPSSDGTATFSASHALAIADLNTVSISEEDAGADPGSPRGPVVLAGALR